MKNRINILILIIIAVLGLVFFSIGYQFNKDSNSEKSSKVEIQDNLDNLAIDSRNFVAYESVGTFVDYGMFENNTIFKEKLEVKTIINKTSNDIHIQLLEMGKYKPLCNGDVIDIIFENKINKFSTKVIKIKCIGKDGVLIIGGSDARTMKSLLSSSEDMVCLIDFKKILYKFTLPKIDSKEISDISYIKNDTFNKSGFYFKVSKRIEDERAKNELIVTKELARVQAMEFKLRAERAKKSYDMKKHTELMDKARGVKGEYEVFETKGNITSYKIIK